MKKVESHDNFLKNWADGIIFPKKRASSKDALSLSKKRVWSGKLHKEVLFADANELWIKAWKILTRHFASKMTCARHQASLMTASAAGLHVMN